MKLAETSTDKLIKAFTETYATDDVAVTTYDTGRLTIGLVSSKYEGVPYLTRQDEAWKLAKRTIGDDATLKIVLIHTLAPSEVESPHEFVHPV